MDDILKVWLFYKYGLKAEFYGLKKEYDKDIKKLFKKKK